MVGPRCFLLESTKMFSPQIERKLSGDEFFLD